MKKRKTTQTETVVDDVSLLNEGVETIVIDEPEQEIQPLTEPEPEVSVTKPAPVVVTPPAPIKPSTPVPAHTPSAAIGVELRMKKKRVRDRRKATKKLSAAVLCANPGIKRFI